MKNYVQHGDTLPLTAPSGGVVSGMLYIIGSLAGVALGSAAEGDAFEMKTCGVFDLPKTAANVVAEGAKLYWTGSELTTTASGNDLVGVAVAAAGNGVATAQVKIGPSL
ncbi:MAG: DUF2190 family protein [Pseudomonadota bacterium]